MKVSDKKYLMILNGALISKDKNVYDTFKELEERNELYNVIAYCMELVTYGGLNLNTDTSTLDVKVDKIIEILNRLTNKTIDLDKAILYTNQQLKETTTHVKSSKKMEEMMTKFNNDLQGLLDYVTEGDMLDRFKELIAEDNTLAIKALQQHPELLGKLDLTQEETDKVKKSNINFLVSDSDIITEPLDDGEEGEDDYDEDFELDIFESFRNK